MKTFWNSFPSPLQSLHICSLRNPGTSSPLIPFSLLMWYFILFQAASASCVWIPLGSTKLSSCTTTWCSVTLGTWAVRFLYPGQSSECNSEPGRRTRCRIGASVALSLRCTTWKYPRHGVLSVLITPNTHWLCLARRPLWYWKRNDTFTLNRT